MGFVHGEFLIRIHLYFCECGMDHTVLRLGGDAQSRFQVLRLVVNLADPVSLCLLYYFSNAFALPDQSLY